MGSTTTQTTIINRALQLVGYKSVGSINDNDRGARAMNRAYIPVLESELRSNYWSFSIKRAVLPASSVTPAFGPAFYYPLPGDYLDLAPPDQFTNYTFGAIPVPRTNQMMQYTDWKLENNNGTWSIVSDQVGPLNVRYVSNAITESMFDSCFSEAFSASLAMNTCEELTQSNTKLADIEKFYEAAILRGKQRNAFEQPPVYAPIDSYILSRM